jgi:hypothetical protein
MQFMAFHGSEKLQANNLADLNNTSNINGFYRGNADDETGLYLSAADGESYAKQICIERGGKNKKSFNMEVTHYPSFEFWPMTKKTMAKVFTYKMPYNMKLGVYSGGTEEACKIYRSWAKDQKWMSRGKIRNPNNPDKNKLSKKVLDCAFWGKFYHGAGKVVGELASLKKYFGVPVNTQWYRYKISKFDNNNLEYFPVDPYFYEGISTLKKIDIGVMPYVCCAVWDMDRDSWDKYNLEEAAAMGAGGSPYIWTLAGQPSAWMNPASPLWREKYIDASKTLFWDWGTNGQYLDVLACAGGDKQCYNDKINKPHGGNYWSEGNRKLLDELRETIYKKSPDCFLTTEGFSENYIDKIDAFLLLDTTRYGWKGTTKDICPLFAFVYHDYAVPFGSDCNQYIDAEALRWEMGLSFVWGMQPTYSSSVILKPESGKGDDKYTREVVRAWHQAGAKFLTGGLGIYTAQIPEAKQMGNAAVGVISPKTVVNCKSIFKKDFNWNGPSVMASSWRAVDNTIGITMTNITDKEKNAEIIIDTEKLACSGKILWQSWPLPAKKIGKIEGVYKLSKKLSAASAMIFEIRDNTAPEIKPLVNMDWELVEVEKDGAFPSVIKPENNLWGAEGSIVKNEITDNNTITLFSKRTGNKRKVNTVVNWGAEEGIGKPRHPEDRPFCLLEKTSFTFDGICSASISYSKDVIYGMLEIKRAGKLSGKVNSTIIAVELNKAGKAVSVPLITSNTQALKAGKYRFAAWINDKGMLPLHKNASFRSLAKLSQSCAKKATRIISFGRDIAENEKESAAKLFATGNAVSYVAIGAKCTYNLDTDWILPYVDSPLSVQLDEGEAEILNGKIHQLRTDIKKYVEVRKKSETNFKIKFSSTEKVGYLLPLMYSGTASYNGNSFIITDIAYLEVDRPLIVETDGDKRVINTAVAGKTINTAINVNNPSPYDLDVGVIASLPEGWTLLSEKKIKLKAFDSYILPVKIKTSEASDKKHYKLRVYLNYTDNDAAKEFEEFKVSMRVGNLAPFVDNISKTVPQWAVAMRHGGQAAVVVNDKKKIKFFVKERSVAGRKRKKIIWKIFNDKMEQIKTGTILPKAYKDAVTITVPKHGVYYISFKGTFFSVKIDYPYSCAYSASEGSPYIFFGNKSLKTMYFSIPGNAKHFAISGQDGGAAETAHIRIKNSDGKVVFERDGRWFSGVWYNVEVGDVKSAERWTMEINAQEDLRFMMKGDVTPWLSPTADSVLTLKK